MSQWEKLCTERLSHEFLKRLLLIFLIWWRQKRVLLPPLPFPVQHRSKVPAWGRDNRAASVDETPPARLWTRPSVDSRRRGSSCGVRGRWYHQSWAGYISMSLMFKWFTHLHSLYSAQSSNRWKRALCTEGSFPIDWVLIIKCDLWVFVLIIPLVFISGHQSRLLK